MPIQNTQGAFNTGRDGTLVLIDAVFGSIQINNITGFNAKQTTDKVRVKRMDGVVLMGDIPQTWGGSFMSERAGPSLDLYFSGLEDSWFNSGIITGKTMYFFAIEPDGSQTTFEYDNACLSFTNAGDWSADKSVKLNVSWEANRRSVTNS